MDRLTGQDLSNLWPEDFGWPQDIGALVILEGRKLLEADGSVRIQAVRDDIGRRLHAAPRFRQVLYHPRWGLGRPLWVDAQSFDLADHVRVFPVSPPGDEGQLLQACEALRRRRLHRARPLWELWLLPGLPDGRVGLFVKLHHVIADGVAGMAILGALMELAPDAPPPVAPPWTPAPPPSASELLADNLRRRGVAIGATLTSLTHPVHTLRRARRAWPAVKELFAEARAPRTSLNRPIGSDRRLAVVRGRLDLAKVVAHTHAATVNDVVLAAIAGGLGELLRSRGEPTKGLVLRAAVPVSLHGRSDDVRGNVDGGMVVPLAVHEPDPIRRLRLIAAETTARKRNPRPQFFTGILGAAAVQRAALRLMGHQRLVNVYVANVPGPPVPLYLAGARLLELFPVVPISGNVTVGVGVLSYAGQLNFVAVADRDTCPDVDVFADGLHQALHQLGVAVDAWGDRAARGAHGMAAAGRRGGAGS